MSIAADLPSTVRENLFSIYEEIMWLAQRPNVKPACARAWYTHISSVRLRRQIRRFTGKVSRKAAFNETAILRLEHFKRIQTSLTQLVAHHVSKGIYDADEFINLIIEFEQVHIVTVRENYEAMKAKGNYCLAGIDLLEWEQLPKERREVLWKKMLNGRVANAQQFAVGLSD